MELQPNYLIIKHDTFPLPSLSSRAIRSSTRSSGFRAPRCWAAPRRAAGFRPASIVNVSGMSFGSLSGPAVEALNRGSQMAGCLQSTGEGGVSSHHLKGGDLVWQVGTGLLRLPRARRPLQHGQAERRRSRARRRSARSRSSSVRAPSRASAGCCPRAKITREIADIRGIPMDRDCISPAAHSAFRNADEMLDFVESIAGETGLPVGIKSAVGDSAFWEDLAR